MSANKRNKILANGGRHYISDVFFSWLRPCLVLSWSAYFLQHIIINIHIYRKKWHGIETETPRCTPLIFVTPFTNLTHGGRVTHICVGNLTIIGSDNGLSPGRRQAIIWTNAGILLIRPLGTNSEILIVIQTSSFKKMHLKMSSAKWRPFCPGLNVFKGD